MTNASQNHEETLVEYIPLKVSAGVLLQIGAGIYNSVAAAFKELVSNAFDADASEITISTDVPRFERIKIVDDGTGMTADHFRQTIQMVGSSLKATISPSRVTPTYKRPIIGRFGIGLMALSQLCDKATIESTVKGSSTKFIAELYFTQFNKEAKKQREAAQLDLFREQYGGLDNMKRILDSPETEDYVRSEVQDYVEIARQAHQILVDKKLEDPEGEHLGYGLIYRNLPGWENDHYTMMTLEGIKPGVQHFLQDKDRPLHALPQSYQRDQGWAKYRKDVNRLKWPELIQKLATADSGLTYQSLPQYHQFLWKLALISPISYLPDGPVTIQPKILADKKKELSRFDFSVRVDNRVLFKPIYLPAGVLAKESDYQIEHFWCNENVGSEFLTYQGYIYWQRTLVQPGPLRGIQIYVRHVGIGIYDHTLMGFQIYNSSLSDHISGEIYVEEGLERALNIERDGFRKTDEHYVALQKHVWQILGSLAKGNRVISKQLDAYQGKHVNGSQLLTHTQEMNGLLKPIGENQFSALV